MPWIRNVESIEYTGEFPIAWLNFIDDKLPIAIRLEAFSPFIPGDVKNSSLPAAIFIFQLKNTSDEEVQVSLLSGIRNPMSYNAPVAVHVNSVVEEDKLRAIFMSAEELPPDHIMYNGSMCLATLGDDVTYYGMLEEMRSYAPGLLRAGAPWLAMWVDFRADGRLNNTPGGKSRTPIYGILCNKVVLKPGEEREIVFILTWYFPNHIDTKGVRVGHAYENWFRDALDVMRYVIKNLEKLRELTERFHDTLYDTTLDYWIVDSISAQLTTLIKNSFFTKDFKFGLWEGGPGCCGLQTLDVSYYGSIPIVLLFPELEKAQLRLTADFQLRAELPKYELYALAFPENLEEYVKAIRERPEIAINEELRKKTITDIVKRTGKDPTGRIPHFFPGTFSDVDAYHMVDLMPKFTLLVYRDYLWTGDKEFLKSMWPHVRRAMEHVLKCLDEAKMLLPYHHTPAGGDVSWRPEIIPRGSALVPIGFQTYDGWSHIGYAAYTGIIWLAALKALEAMARELGEEEYARKVSSLFEKAKENLEKLLWNGEYYDLWYDPLSGRRDRCCMADQLNGQWYANMCSLGRLLPEDHVRSALKAIIKYNKKPEEGLVNGAYPDGKRPAMHGNMKYPNNTQIDWLISSQSDTPWTGTEYAVASLLIQEGLVKEGLEVAREVYERYAQAGMTWNHIECGEHYYRAMSVWAILLALEGLHYNASRGVLSFMPIINEDDFKAPFALLGSWGSMVQRRSGRRQENLILLRYGSLRLRVLRLKLPEEAKGKELKILITLDGREIAHKWSLEENILSIEMEKELIIKEDETLKVAITW
ncbi:MAG: hypothetical protein DRM97_02380 [Thermoprotei archaeon]|nr:MAG: hypothetical protein DRM97_02380 [Thermoprotei archaeon]